MGFFDPEGRSGSLDVVAMLDSECGKLIAQAVDYGALVSLSKTSDGGALGVTVTVDGVYVREYFRNGEDLELWLGNGMADIKGAAEDARAARASSVPRKRSRGL